MSAAVSPAPYCSRFAGTPIYARGWSVLAEYKIGWSPTPGWERYQQRPHCWSSGAWPHIILWAPTQNRVCLLSRAKEKPPLANVEQCAIATFGVHAIPVARIAMPTALRMPMIGPMHLAPTSNCRCSRLKSAVRRYFGVDVEFRLSVTRLHTSTTFFVEAMLGAAHETHDGRARALFYSGDARSVPRLPDVAATKRFFKLVLHGLVRFADDLAALAIAVDPNGRHQLSRVATIGVEKDDDVFFDVSLPTATSSLDFIV